MNRRWSVALVIVVLAALAPGAALAGPAEKPLDAITAITWTSIEAGPDATADECNSSVTIQYTVAKGAPRRYEIQWRQADGYISAYGAKVERDGESTVSRTISYMDVAPPLVNGAPAYVQVRLMDAKGNTLAGPVMTTPAYQFPEGSCPDSGISLGTY